MQVNLIGVGLALTLCSSVALADSYQTEVGVGYARTDFDGVSDDLDTWSGHAQYHFAPVETEGRVLAEAAFLQRSSNLFVNGARSKIDSLKANQVTAGLEVYVPDSMLYFASSVSTAKIAGERDEDWSLAVGVTPLDGMLVRLSYADEADVWGLDGKYVTVLGGNTVNFEAGYSNADDDDAYFLGGDFYFDRTFSVGLEYAVVDPDGASSEDAVSLRARKFFTERFSGELSYTHSDDADAEGVALAVALRF